MKKFKPKKKIWNDARSTNSRSARIPLESLPEGHFLIDSPSALEVYLKHRPQAIRKITATQAGLSKIAHHPALQGIPVEITPPEASSSKIITAEVEHTTLSEAAFMKRLSLRKRDLVIALDHITDPRNLGAIARSACYFGVKEIIVPARRQVLLTQASVSTAQGAFAFLDLVEVGNLHTFLRKLKEHEYWVLTADMAGESFATFKNIYDRSVLVMGAEDKGISPIIKKLSDRTITIDGAEPSLGSLNVSVAAGILLRGLFDQEKT